MDFWALGGIARLSCCADISVLPMRLELEFLEMLKSLAFNLSDELLKWVYFDLLEEGDRLGRWLLPEGFGELIEGPLLVRFIFLKSLPENY